MSSCHQKFSLITCFVLAVIGLIANPSTAAAQGGPPKLAINVNLYPYLHRVKDDTDLSVTINARLPRRFSYSSFVDIRGVIGDGGTSFERSEQNLRWSLPEDLPFDLNLQAILVNGTNNDLWQLGIGWRVNDTNVFENFFDRLNLIYRLTFHFKRFSSGDDKVWQLEHYFRITFPGNSKRLYLSGFMDHTFGLDLPDAFPRNPIVSQVQLGLRLFKEFYAVTEYRITDFRLSEEHNLAVGVEYKFRW